jgi:hypothetical protein
MQAADRLHCPPWELLERGAFWTEWALIAAEAEAEAQRQLQRKYER